MTISDRIVATIRTAVPALVGLILARLIAAIPAVGDALVWIGAQIGTPVEGLVSLLATAAVITAYYWLARRLGDRWPWVERWLLGSSLVPVYAPEAVQTAKGDVYVMTRAEYRTYLEDVLDDAAANQPDRYTRKPEDLVE